LSRDLLFSDTGDSFCEVQEIGLNVWIKLNPFNPSNIVNLQSYGDEKVPEIKVAYIKVFTD
jgi:hypothetical protein